MEKRDRLYLQHINDAVDKIIAFTRGKTLRDFESDDLLQGAVIHQLLIIGEAANHVSDEFQVLHPEFDWQGMIGMRNKLIHDYFRASIDEVWKTVQDDIPELKKLLEIFFNNVT